MSISIFTASPSCALTLTWTGGGDGSTFDQLANWSGTPTGGTIDINNLVDKYVVDSPSANITGIGDHLEFRDGGELNFAAGNLNALASGVFGLGLLESPRSFGSLVFTGGTISAQFLAEMDVAIGGDALLLLAGGNDPVNNSSVNLTSPDSAVHFTNETPTAFANEHLSKFNVLGSPAQVGVNLSVVSDGGSGSIVSAIGGFSPNIQLLVDRDTGQLTLSNTTGQPVEFFEYDIFSPAGALDETAWTSVAGAYDDESNGGDESVDADDAWFRFTAPGSRTDLAEGTVGEATLAHTQTIDLGAAWIASPFEDLVATLALTDGTDLPVEVVYSGSVLSDQVGFGDFNADGVVDATDWPLMRSNLFGDISGLLAVDAHASGDMDGNGRVDEFDFVLFEAAFNLSQGRGAFEQLLAGVPEPSSLILIGLTGAAFATRRRLVDSRF